MPRSTSTSWRRTRWRRSRFAGCAVPASAQLGALNGGFKLAMQTLDIFRASVAAAALGMARRALAEAVRACPPAPHVRPDAGGLPAHAGQDRRDGRADRRRRPADLPRRLDARRSPAARQWQPRRGPAAQRCSGDGQDDRHRKRPAGDRHGAADARRAAVWRSAPRSKACTATSARCASTKAPPKCSSSSSARPFCRSSSMNQPSRMPAFAPHGVSAQTDRFVHDRLPPRGSVAHLALRPPGIAVPGTAEPGRGAAGQGRCQGLCRAPPAALQPRHVQLRTDVAERVNRIAQLLTEDMALVPGNRVLLRGGNSIGMALAWLAVVKAGLIAVATMPLLRARELGDIIDKAQPVLALCDATLLAELEQAQRDHPVLRTIAEIQRAGRPVGSRRAVRRQVRHVCALPDGGRRHCLDGLHLGHHRQAQGRDPHPPRRAGRLRGLAAPCAARHARRHRDGLAAAGLHLRPGRDADLPDVGRRLGVLPGHRLHAGGHGAPDRRSRRHDLLHRADLLPADGAVCQGRRNPVAAPVRERRRGPAGRHAHALARGHRHRDDRRHRCHRDVPHLHLVRRRRGPARCHRQGGAGLHRESGQRRKAPSCRAAPSASSR